MLAGHKLNMLENLVGSLSAEELGWVKGYLDGIISASPAHTVNRITITYGTETGNSKRIATDFAARAKKNGINVKLVSLDQYRLNDLSKEEYFFTIVSTHGDGEPPEASKKFYDHIHNNGFRCEKLKYSVLALGDTSYPLFCKTGEDIDGQLNRLGGVRIAPLQKCDVEFDEEAGSWLEKVLQTLHAPAAPLAAPAVVPESKKATGKKIYRGTVLGNVLLNDRGAEKETWHLELSADELAYEPGDSAGIVPENTEAEVEKVLALTNTDPNREIEYRNEWFTVYDLLKKRVNIIQLVPSVVKKYAALVGKEIPEKKADLAELLRLYPIEQEKIEEALLLLNPIAPRLYTIASSPLAHDGEVHLTVKKDVFKVGNEIKEGLCSAWLAGLEPDTGLSFFIQKNKRFRLPADDKDIIMIGPGTGIAAFRSFLAERNARNASGRNWLFFGEQHFTTDFLYQTEIQDWISTGLLTKIHTAFSRDQAEKIYVQHRMLEQSEELYRWLESGASIYLCGTKDPMSTDVERVLLQIIAWRGQLGQEDAKKYLEALKEEGRYEKDVY